MDRIFSSSHGYGRSEQLSPGPSAPSLSKQRRSDRAMVIDPKVHLDDLAIVYMLDSIPERKTQNEVLFRKEDGTPLDLSGGKKKGPCPHIARLLEQLKASAEVPASKASGSSSIPKNDQICGLGLSRNTAPPPPFPNPETLGGLPSSEAAYQWIFSDVRRVSDSTASSEPPRVTRTERSGDENVDSSMSTIADAPVTASGEFMGR